MPLSIHRPHHRHSHVFPRCRFRLVEHCKVRPCHIGQKEMRKRPRRHLRNGQKHAGTLRRASCSDWQITLTMLCISCILQVRASIGQTDLKKMTQFLMSIHYGASLSIVHVGLSAGEPCTRRYRTRSCKRDGFPLQNSISLNRSIQLWIIILIKGGYGLWNHSPSAPKLR
jgi:hypothetical protein